jgi:hypothetical protein
VHEVVPSPAISPALPVPRSRRWSTTTEVLGTVRRSTHWRTTPVNPLPGRRASPIAGRAV